MLSGLLREQPDLHAVYQSRQLRPYRGNRPGWAQSGAQAPELCAQTAFALAQRANPIQDTK